MSRHKPSITDSYTYQFTIPSAITKCENCPLYNWEQGECWLNGEIHTRNKNCPLVWIRNNS